MKRGLSILLFLLIAAVAVTAITVAARHGGPIAVLQTKGTIAHQQRDLMLTAVLLMLIVVIPVFLMTAFIAWKYRATNTKADYKPDWDHSAVAESIWWGIPTAIILVLAVLTWKTSHSLDPFKPIESDTPPITIQVVALQWKWLFIYPEQNISTVNYVAFPEDTPVRFEITADAPMNSFWIPQLGGQIYAMPGMSSELQLMADAPGVYAGSSANLSGAGFASMAFAAQSFTKADFDTWVSQVKETPAGMTDGEYDKLAQPSEKYPVTYYSYGPKGMYNRVVMKYMHPLSHYHPLP